MTKISIGFNSLKFDLDNDGEITYAVMLELSGADRNRYMEFVDKNVQRDAEGRAIGMKSWKRSQTFLLSLCLHHAKIDETGRPVVNGDSYEAGDLITEQVLASWPDHPLQLLSQSAVSLSKLAETRKDAGKRLRDGDTQTWLRLATTLGATVQETKSRVSAAEFNLWIAHFEDQDEKKWDKGAEPTQHYIAQLTATVANLLAKHPRQVDDFLIEFTTGTSQGQSPAEIQQHFLNAVGL